MADEHAGINLSGPVGDPSVEEIVKQWARDQDTPTQYENCLRSLEDLQIAVF